MRPIASHLWIEAGSPPCSPQMPTSRSGRSTRPDLEVGICGEHGGDPASIHKCEAIGLNYVSCSPFRVPVARLAAAQAVLVNAAENDK